MSTSSLGLTALVVFGLYAFHRQLVYTTFDAVGAQVVGIRTGVVEYVLLALLALVIVIGIQAAGIVLVMAMLITPAATGYLLAKRFVGVMLVGAGIGALSAIAGLYLSLPRRLALGPRHGPGRDGVLRAGRRLQAPRGVAPGIDAPRLDRGRDGCRSLDCPGARVPSPGTGARGQGGAGARVMGQGSHPPGPAGAVPAGHRDRRLGIGTRRAGAARASTCSRMPRTRTRTTSTRCTRTTRRSPTHQRAPHYAAWKDVADTLDGPVEVTRLETVFPANADLLGEAPPKRLSPRE